MKTDEEKVEYMGEKSPDNTYKISDEAPHDHFSQIPNIVDDMNLTPYAYRLYGHLRRVAGETGKCWQSTSTLAKACGMSTGTVSKGKQELENVFPPLIRVISKQKDDGSIYHEIFVSDIWKINHDHYSGNPVHLVKGLARSQGETYRSRGETKKNPLDQEEPSDEKTTLEYLKNTTKAERQENSLNLLADMANFPGAKKQARIDAILSYLGERFRVNTETKKWKDFAKFIDNEQQNKGQRIEVFVAWLIGQDGFQLQYWPPAKMQEFWPSAFVIGEKPTMQIIGTK